MGKVKKSVLSSKPEGQQSIQSFFQKSSELSKKSKLFSEHGAVQNPVSSKLHFSNACIVIGDDADDFKEEKSKSKGSVIEKKKCVDDCNSKPSGIKPVIYKVPHQLSNVGGTDIQEHVQVIPETQLPFTPPYKDSGKGVESKKDPSEFGLIPDTPDEKDILKPKRPLGRSFLLSATQMASNPIKEAKENRRAKLDLKRKQASLARKGLMAVSVKFNEEDSSKSNGVLKMETGDINQTNIYCDGSIKEDHLDIGAKTTVIADNENSFCIDEKHIPVIDGETRVTDVQGNTPTKFYCESGSLKRMAKHGCSPDSKRLSDGNSSDKTEFSENGKSGLSVKQLSFDSTNNCKLYTANGYDKRLEADQSKQEVNRKKLERLKQREIEIKMVAQEERRRTSEKILKYQLMGATSSDQLCQPEALVTVATDDTLDDILQELGSPGIHSNKPTAQHVFTKTKPLQKKIPSKGPENKPYGTADMGEDKMDGNTSLCDWTAEDDEYFSMLGVSTEQGIKKHEQFTESYRTDGKFKSTSYESNYETVQKTGNTSYKETIGKSCNIHNQEVVQKTSNIGNRDALEKKSKVLTISAKTAQRRKSNGSDSVDRNKDSYDGMDDEVGEIESYLTQGCHGDKGQKSNTHEVDIEEFVSQQSHQLNSNPVRGEKRKTVASDQTPAHVAPCSQYGRHLVTKVDHYRVKHQTVLELSSTVDGTARSCTLHGFWLDTHVEVGDTVHVLGEFVDGHSHITDTAGLLIVNPDLLLSGTTVVSSVFCMRKSILKEKFKGCDSRNVHMLYGSIIHSVFQQILRKQLFKREDILFEAEAIVRQASNLLEMYANETSEVKVLEEVKSYIPQMITWLTQYTSFKDNRVSSSSNIQVTKVCDIEENIWSPRIGIKGKIDLTVEAKIQNEPGRVTLPLELKTGKTSFSVEHKGQVSLYSMMYGDRRKDPKKGLLLYLKEPSMKVIPAEHIHQKGLIQMRNEMAYYISRQVVKTADDTGVTFNLGRLPEPISNTRACQKCPQLINCAIYQREVENRPLNSSAMAGLVNESLGHLTPGHMMYFVQWCLMLDLETQTDQSKKTVANIWCKSSVDREEGGECLGGMVLEIGGANADDGAAGESSLITFHRHRDHCRQASLSSVGICAHDSVVVSRESPAWVAVCTGFVHEITPLTITILTEREGIERLHSLSDVLWRIDKCDNFSTAGILYTSVSRLMLDTPQSNKLRRLIIDKVKPEFVNTLSKGNIEKVKAIFKSLNQPQKTAILKVLMSKDYVLIKGYPGTGKTSTIVAMVKVLHALGLSVLLTSYTHSAVDNILLKLKQDSMSFLRVGRVSKMHPEIRPFSVDSLTAGFTTVEQLETFYMKQKIVASSCLGLNHALFTRRQFDVCIVDEASQVVQPACLAPLFIADRFVLVGDPKQLPPVVQSKEARELGMDESLFLHLDGQQATFELHLQYRMNREILKLSNSLVYEGRLQCGSEAVATQTLTIPHPHMACQVIAGSAWMRQVIDVQLTSSVVFLNTEKLSASHSKVQGGGFRNETEANIVNHVIKGFAHVGISGSEIGVIAPYRGQVLHLREKLGQGHHQGSSVEVNTVDQYQGRDKDIIIISFVMSSSCEKEKPGELLKDARRLNVAVTRARYKLILVGNVSTLRQYGPLDHLLNILATDQQIVTIERISS